MSIDLYELVAKTREEGYEGAYAEAKVVQDIVLKAIEQGDLGQNVTIKGGIVMRSITKNKRRATRDMDFDFIRYSLDDESIRRFVQKLNSLDRIKITIKGRIEELSQQEYKGKRVHIAIKDKNKNVLHGKIDLGVHANLDIRQEEHCFDVCCSDDGANLLMNSKEQIFAEKMRSLLKFGARSTRYKDVFDMYFLSQSLNTSVLFSCLERYVFSDEKMREKDVQDIASRLTRVFSDPMYAEKLRNSISEDWLEVGADAAMSGLLAFVSALA